MTLTKYHKKRKFGQTPEPEAKKRSRLRAANWPARNTSVSVAGGRAKKRTSHKKLRFVVQEHHATRLHFDFRLEMEGVLKSWAVPKGPSMDPSVKHLAVHVEDHPFAYRKFHGTIPEGNYGAGKVYIWDEGTYEPFEQTDNPARLDWTDKARQEKTLLAGLRKGDLKFILHGKKLKGAFVLVRMKGEEGKNWLLIKEKESSLRGSGFAGDEAISYKRSPRFARDDKRIRTKKIAFPHEIKPMLAKVADAPFDDPDWIYEIKWDGYRAITEIQSRSNRDKKGKVRLYSRNQQNFTTAYPDIVEALAKIKHDVILDGEIVALDKDGKAQFQLLQEYRKNKEVSLVYYIFDLLYLDGYDERLLPLIERKVLLKKLLPESKVLKYSDHIDAHGLKAFAFAKEKNLEGIMAKRKQSRYASVRSSEWQKIKLIKMQEAVICGFTEPKGQRKAFGALILGLFDKGEYRYIGHTGGGFDEKKLQEILKLLRPLRTNTSPFATPPVTNMPATWVKPKIVAQVKFNEWTRDGIMRQPVFLGLRDDKKPKEVTQEQIVIASEATRLPKPGTGGQEQSHAKGIAASSSSSAPVKQAGSLANAQSAPRNDGKVELSNLEKIFWPEDGYTKGDVISYYDRVAPYILPYLLDRPQSMLRQPNGISGESFFQKDVQKVPEWVKTVAIHSPGEEKNIHWLVCNDRDTLLYMANLGCIEINPWSARVQTKEHPDYLIIDLDPNGVNFKEVVITARFIKKIMDKVDLDGFVKTSGKTGLHILLPLGAKYTFDQTKQFAEILAKVVAHKLPDTTSVTRDPKKREKKIYVDFLQNRQGQTITAPYSLRPVPLACVSTPLDWKELTSSLHPTDFTIKNILRRLEKKGDVWKGFLHHKGIDMLKSLKALEKLSL